jgi:LysM repeat protein
MTTPVPPADDPLNPPAHRALRVRARGRFKRLSPAAKYGALFAMLAILTVLGLVIMHGLRTEPRDSRMIADREVEVNVLEPGEKVENIISVFRRTPIDYFRATRGVLVLTNKRMVFLGLRPRDMLSPTDAPPTFNERDFPIDTAVSVTTGRAMAGLTKGVVVKTPDETIRLGVPESSWPEAQKLVAKMVTRREGARTTAQKQEELRKVADAEWKKAVEAWRQPQHYTVRGGDALGSIATRWNTTPEELQRLNKLPDNRIRVGQTLLVRDAM